MNKKYVIVFVFICAVQFLLVVFLGVRIASKTNNFTSFPRRIWMIPQSKDSVVLPQVSTLTYYYEPKPLSMPAYDLNFVGVNKKVIHTINADGLNERYDYPVTKSDGVYRIIALGDSFTEGALVDTKDNWTEQLEDMLNNSLRCTTISKFEVINLGVAGYDMEYSLERFKRKGLQYNPDLVLFFAGQDDFDFPNELLLGKVHRLDAEFAASPERLKKYQDNGDMYPSYTLASQEFTKEQGDGMINQILKDEFHDLNELMNIVPGKFVIMPYHRLPDTMLTVIQAYVGDHNNTYYFPQVGVFDRFKDSHPTPTGHATIARYFFDSLPQANIIPCDELK